MSHSRRTIIAFSDPTSGTFRCMLPTVSSLAAAGHDVHLFGHSTQKVLTERAGAHFVDMYGSHSLEAADDITVPVISRFVTFAAVYAEAVAAEVKSLGPDVIVYETFAVIAPVVARLLGVPYVNVVPNPLTMPSARPMFEQFPGKVISDACWEAVARLRDVHGMANAHPFLWLDGVSPYLNLYCEPEEFLEDSRQAEIQPLEFVGCLAPELAPPRGAPTFEPRDGRTRVYASFGTFIWVYFAELAIAALEAIAASSDELRVDLVITLGGFAVDASARRRLEDHAGVKVVDFADQWSALQDTDVFITHHGVNSTHEGIYREVPMISYPFFGDQPMLAARCQDLGLATPLAPEMLAPVEPGALGAALERIAADADGYAERLAGAREREQRTSDGRAGIVARIASLAD
jgi:UDP:flavonoid glycosyltransferase YjiC (YdhE family)